LSVILAQSAGDAARLQRFARLIEPSPGVPAPTLLSPADQKAFSAAAKVGEGEKVGLHVVG
jgi:hypothetical protein